MPGPVYDCMGRQPRSLPRLSMPLPPAPRTKALSTTLRSPSVFGIAVSNVSSDIWSNHKTHKICFMYAMSLHQSLPNKKTEDTKLFIVFKDATSNPTRRQLGDIGIIDQLAVLTHSPRGENEAQDCIFCPC